MEAGVGSGVEIDVETDAVNVARHGADSAPLTLRLLGPPALWRAGEPLALPPSRKVRALLAYLAMAGREVSRSHLCELLWDLPADPRGELRWCLSKLRGLLDDPGRTRVLTRGEAVALDLQDCRVDALRLVQALQQGIAGCAAGELQVLAKSCAAGEFVEGLALPRSPVFDGWVTAQRRRLRDGEAAVLEHLVRVLPAGDAPALAALERWVAIAPFDRRAHAGLLDALAATGRLREGEAHLAATARRFEAEGQDWAPIGHAWRAARLRHAQGGSAPNEPMASGVVATMGTALWLREAAAPVQAAAARRASLAVMPFADLTPGAALRGGVGDGLAYDVITRLAKLRCLFVIAPGSVFALDERHVGAEDAARRLDVDYIASGALRREPGGRLRVSVQMAETRSARVLWAEEFSGMPDDTFELLDGIGNRIVGALAQQVETAERNRAVLKAPGSLNAWEAHHRGLWHMVRFNREDNEQARHFFQAALRLDPTFSRPYAGLSFTHFQDAFQGWRERGPAVEQAYRIASQGLMADDRDPAAHWALGRALWLQGRQDASLGELAQAVDLSPNFALGHYTLAFVHSQSGDPQAAIAESDHSRALSPFDPLLFAMFGTRAMALMRLGRHDEAAEWALKAAARPNAHVHIQGLAFVCLALAGRGAEARAMAAALQRVQPGYGVDDLLRAFRFGEDGEALVRKADGFFFPR